MSSSSGVKDVCGILGREARDGKEKVILSNLEAHIMSTVYFLIIRGKSELIGYSSVKWKIITAVNIKTHLYYCIVIVYTYIMQICNIKINTSTISFKLYQIFCNFIMDPGMVY